MMRVPTIILKKLRSLDNHKLKINRSKKSLRNRRPKGKKLKELPKNRNNLESNKSRLLLRIKRKMQNLRLLD